MELSKPGFAKAVCQEKMKDSQKVLISREAGELAGRRRFSHNTCREPGRESVNTH